MAFAYQLVSVRISPFCELARWVLDLQGLPYQERCHAPIWNVPFTWRAGRTVNVPVVTTPDAALEIGSFLEYGADRARPDHTLLPSGNAARKDIQALTASILTGLAIDVRLYAYANMLPNRRVTAALMTARAPWLERVLVTSLYPLQAWAMRKVLKITPASTEQARANIMAAFDQLSKRLASSGPYLGGDRLSAADLAFAASAAPALLPPEYGAPFPTFADLPAVMAETVRALQATPAGELAMRVYREYRQPAYSAFAVAPSTGETFRDRCSHWFQRMLASPGLLRLGSHILRMKPVWRLGKTTLVSTYGAVVGTLNADEKFTIAQINAARMDRISGPFILGMDRSAQFDRDSAAIQAVVKSSDLDDVRRIVTENAQALIAAARPQRRLDLADGYARIVAARVVAQHFGVPGPSEGVLMQWLRSLFWDVFLNRSDAPLVRRAADAAASQLRAYLVDSITKRSAQGAAGDDLLSRLIRAGALDAEGVRRNITGIIVGAIDTTVTAAANIFHVLLDKPEAMQQARQAAAANDETRLRQCAYEALRFRPQTAALLRYSQADGSTVVPLTISAMFDPSAFPEPGQFRTDRPLDRYLHFGHGMHTCYGRMINGVQLPALLGAVVRLPNLHRASGGFRKILYEGPFPQRCAVEFGGEA